MQNGKDETPKLQIVNDKIFWLDDDLSLAQFLRKVWPEIMDLMDPYFARVRAGEHITYVDLAFKFRVRKTTIQQVINTDRWDHLLEPGQAQALAQVREQRRNNHNLKHKRRSNDYGR